MVYVDWSCDLCKHKLGMKDGWKPTCKAFPEGIPVKYVEKGTDIPALAECANGYKWEPKDTEGKQ